MGLLRWLKHALGARPSPGAPARAPAPGSSSNDAAASPFHEAVARQTRGDLDGAEALYRSALERDADFVPALHLLARIHAQRGTLREAGLMLERARSLAPDDADILADLAEVRRLDGGAGAARPLLERAVSLQPEVAALHYALAGARLEQGEVDSAIASLERTVALDPAHADGHNDLGAAYLETGRYDEARRALEQAALLRPDSPLAHRNLASLFMRIGEPSPAARHLRLALERAPDDGDLRRRLAEALLRCDDAAAALVELEKAADSDPGDATAWKRLAETAATLDRPADAIAWYRRALHADPERPDVLNDLGILLSGNGQYEDAAQAFQRAVRIRPDFDRGYDNLGATCHLQGRYQEAVAAFSKALEIGPSNPVTLSNFIAVSNYRHPNEPGFVEALHARYRRALAPERARARSVPSGDRGSERRLRLGYVSPDFRQHSVAFFVEPLIEGHDRTRFEVHCYSDVVRPDAVTERLKARADQWRDVSAEDNEALAARIRADGVDLLIDLDGHFACNRLPVFAQRPAPVQIAYLGYPATTGLPEVDFRLTDATADPPGEADREYSETLVRLPGRFLCYRPPADAPPPAGTERENARITFGSFNELPKISPETLAAWARILERVPDAGLLLKATALADPATRQRVMRRFVHAGVPSHRLELLGRTATLAEHLAFYHRVDVALDTFPYNGATTTCEALYMGVPVVTLAGDRHAGRVGASLLGVLELPELVARSEVDYVDKAAALAADTERRRGLNGSLKDRMLSSPLCDEAGFVREIEAAYLRCWSEHPGSRERAAGKPAPRREVEGAVEVRTRDGLRMILPDELERLTTYVMLEQEDWFEDETDFLRSFLDPGMRVLDVGANYGVYTLLAVARVGATGRVFSVEPASATARWLRSNAALNRLDQVEVFEQGLSDQSGKLVLSANAGAECNRLLDAASPFERGELVEVSRLDDLALRRGIESVDFVKLDAEGAEKQILDGGRRFFTGESPLVMFEIRSGEEADLALVDRFSHLGYRPLRLVPGLGLLAPVDPSQPLDGYALNLFACRDDRLEALAGRRLAAVADPPQTGSRPAEEDEVWAHLASGPYARDRIGAWRSRLASNRGEAAREWMRMLGHVVFAVNPESAPALRLSSLEAAFDAVAVATASANPAARLHCLARIAWSLGLRSRAVDALDALLQSNGAGDPFDWPFVPASPHFDAIEPAGRFVEWSDACARDQFERLRAFSSYFLGEQCLDSLQRLKDGAFQRPEMERRRLLVRRRHGMPVTEISETLRVESPDNLNPQLWRDRFGSGWNPET